MKTIQKTAVLLGIAAFLGLAPVGAQAGDIAPPVGSGVKKDRPERPEKPKNGNGNNNSGNTDRPNLTEIRDVVNSFQADSKKFLDSQKQATKDAKDDVRQQMKDLKVTGDIGGQVRKELKDEVKAASDLAKEQARKLKEEAEAAAKGNGHGKN